MGKFSIPEVGTMIGRNRQYVNTYKRRGKIIVTADGLVDLDNPINAAWYKPLREKFMLKLAGVTPDVNTAPNSKKPTAKTKGNNSKIGSTTENDHQNTNGAASKSNELHRATAMMVEKDSIILKIKKQELEKKEIELSKMRGELLDAATAKAIVSSYMKTFTNHLYRDIESLIHQIMDIHQIELKHKSKYVKKVEDIINLATDRTKNEIREKLENDDLKR